MLRSPRALLVVAMLLVATVLPALGTRASAAQPRVALHGSAAPGLANAERRGSVAPTTPMSVAVALQLRNKAELQRFVDEVSNRSSAMSGRYITPQQFTERYGPSMTTVQQVVDYLVAQGLTITSVSSNHTIIDATASAGVMETAFTTSIGLWHDSAEGRDFFANDTEPTLPADIATSVVGVAGLDNHYLQHHSVLPRTNPTCPSGADPLTAPRPGAYCPQQVKTAYDVNALGLTGAGQRVGIFELDSFVQSNLDAYHNEYYGTPSAVPTVVGVDGGSGPLGGGQVEVELDIEVVEAYAPGAAITLFEGPNSAQGVIDTYNAMVTSNTTPANSTSWGQCEPKSSSMDMMTEDNIFLQAAAQGMTFYAASGDFGIYDCTANPSSPDSRVSVDNPADDPYVSGVGGTNLVTNADFTYASESAWGDTTKHLGSGGGLSTMFPRPSWQAGPGVVNGSSTGMRQVPDVAADGDPRTGYSIFTFGANASLSCSNRSCWAQIGGTSAGAPAWAAITALFNQAAASHGEAPLGFANPTLYSLASSSASSMVFHDVTTGNNQINTTGCCTGSFPATANWDYVTGLGSPDVNNLVRALLWRLGNLGAGPLGSTPHVVSWGPGHMDVFWRGTDGALWHKWYVNGWQGFQPLTAPNTIASGAEPFPVSWGQGHIDVFFKGPDGNLWHSWYLNGWHGPQLLGDGPLGSDPQPVSWGQGHIDVFWRGTDNGLWHAWYVNGWNGPGNLGGQNPGMAALGKPHPVSWGPGHIDVFWEDAMSGLAHTWYANGWQGPGGLTSKPPQAATLGSDPYPVSWGQGHIDVFWRGTDNGLWHDFYVGGWHGSESLGGQSPGLNSAPRPVSWGPGSINVFWSASGGGSDLWVTTYANGWQSAAGIGDGPLGSAPPNPVTWGVNFLDVFWMGSDGNLWNARYG